MASFEILSGDFERETVRLRWSDAGRGYMRLTSVDGVVEDVFLATDVAGAAEAGEGRVGEYLARWAERDGFSTHHQPLDGAAGLRSSDGRKDRLFVVLLRDGRKLVARGAPETVAEIKAATLPPGHRPERLAKLDSARAAVVSQSSLLPRLMPGLIARLRPNR